MGSEVGLHLVEDEVGYVRVRLAEVVDRRRGVVGVRAGAGEVVHRLLALRRVRGLERRVGVVRVGRRVGGSKDFGGAC
jgi:hypothetical protein